MKKNKMMRIASVLLVAVILTTCAISGTFAKYVSSADSSDKARVAYWGFNPATMNITDLFANAYDTTVLGDADVNALTDVIAPGTTKSASFSFAYDGTTGQAPEVAYTFEVSTTGSSCADSIKNNPNILWKLDSGDWGTWDNMITAIEALDGNKTGNRYEPGTLPTGFTDADETHTIEWKWIFDENAGNAETTTANNDVNDTAMGNVTPADLAKVTVSITVTATQID